MCLDSKTKAPGSKLFDARTDPIHEITMKMDFVLLKNETFVVCLYLTIYDLHHKKSTIFTPSIFLRKMCCV